MSSFYVMSFMIKREICRTDVRRGTAQKLALFAFFSFLIFYDFTFLWSYSFEKVVLSFKELLLGFLIYSSPDPNEVQRF